MIAVHPAYKTVQEAMGNIKTHGLGLVNDAISIESTSRLNGDMSLSFEVPLNEYNMNLYTADNLICLNGQYYRIQRPERSDTRGEKRIRVEALHVFFDLQKSVIENIETKEDPAFVDGITAEQALNQVLNGSEFSVGTVDLNLDKLEYLDLLRENRFNAIKQILDKWGGEICVDNWTISLYKQMGEDRGVVLNIDQNTDGIRVTEDISKVVTRLYPYGYQETNIESVNDGKDYLDSPNIGGYARILEGYAEFNDIDDPAELKRLAIEKLDELDKPDISVAVDMIKLKKDPQWVFFDEFNGIELGDTVHVPHIALKNNIELRVLEIIRDELTGDAVSLKLGNAKADELFRGFASTVNVAQSAQKEAKKAIRKVNGLNIKADAIEAISAKIREIVAGQITTDQLYADLAAIAAAQIDTADIDYAKIKDIATDSAIITKGEAGKLYIANLAVTDANMVQLTAGALMLKAQDGSFVQLVADGSGGVSTVPVEVEGDNIANATIPGGKLIENSITARELNVQQIFADEALIRAIKAKNIDVADLFAASGTISELNNYLLRTSTIEAIQGKLNVWAEDKISIAVGSKADKAELKSVQESLQSQINAVPGQITAEVSKIQIGGRNLLSLSDDDLTATYANHSKDFNVLCTYKEFMSKPFSISVEIEAVNAVFKTSIYPSLRIGCELAVQFVDGSIRYYGCWETFKENEVNSISPIRINRTYSPINKQIASIRNFGIYIQGLSSGKAIVRRPKLEFGTKATDWSPAPEDAQSQITQLSIDMDAAQEAIKFKADKTVTDGLSTRLSSAEQKITQDAIVSTVRSSTQYTQDLNSKQPKGDYATQSQLTKYSTIEQTDDKIALEVGKIQIGGRNLIYNSTGDLGNRYIFCWGAVSGSVRLDINSDFQLNGHNNIRINDEPQYCVLHFIRGLGKESFVIGDKFTFSCYTYNTTSLSITIGNSNGTNIVASAYNISPKYTKKMPVTNPTSKININYYKVTLTVAGTADKPMLNIATTTTDSFSRFYMIKLEKGNKASDWSPAPEDPASSLNTRSGITIEDNLIDIGTGGKLNMRGGDINMTAGSNMTLSSGANFNLNGGSGSNQIGISNNRSDGKFLFVGDPNRPWVQIPRAAGGVTIIGNMRFSEPSGIMRTWMHPQQEESQLLMTSSEGVIIAKTHSINGQWGYSTNYLNLGAGTSYNYIGRDLVLDGSFHADIVADGTPAYRGDALKEIKMIASDENGNIDHSTLPKCARIKSKKPKLDSDGVPLFIKKSNQKYQLLSKMGMPLSMENDTPAEDDFEEVEGRDVSMMVSMLTVAIQQLTEIVEKQAKQLEELNEKILNKENTI